MPFDSSILDFGLWVLSGLSVLLALGSLGFAFITHQHTDDAPSSFLSPTLAVEVLDDPAAKRAYLLSIVLDLHDAHATSHPGEGLGVRARAIRRALIRAHAHPDDHAIDPVRLERELAHLLSRFYPDLAHAANSSAPDGAT